MMVASDGDLENGSKDEDLELGWRDVRFVVGTKVILDSVWGFARSGSVTVIMGPSGCGKTTLLDALANRIDGEKKGRSLTGSIAVNGGAMKVTPVYVQQEDALTGILTVAETLEFAAALAGEPSERVEELIREFGLESARDTRVGTIFQKGISGGQKRRLSIAFELVSRPRVVLLDEPTSGLDSASALAVVQQLKMIATASDECKGCPRVAVACTLHQPSNAVWDLLDQVCFLAKGKLVYFGKTGPPLLEFLGNVPQYANVADHVLSLINEDFPGHADVDEMVGKFARIATAPSTETSSHGNDVVVEEKKKRAPFFTRFSTLCIRGFREILRDVGIVLVRLLMYTMLSILIALMFLNLGHQKKDSDISARVSVLFYVAAFMVFMSVAVVPFFVIQRAIFIKERCNGVYDVPEYVAAKFVTSIPAVFLLAIVSSVLVVFPARLNGFGIYLLDLFLSLLVAEAFMAFIAAAVPHYIIGIALAAGLFGFNMLCEGFFRVKSDIPDYLIWGYYLGFHTYSFRVFMWNEFHPINHFDSQQYKDGDAVLRFYDMGKVDVAADLLVLVAWVVFFQVAFALVLQIYHTGLR